MRYKTYSCLRTIHEGWRLKTLTSSRTRPRAALAGMACVPGRATYAGNPHCPLGNGLICWRNMQEKTQRLNATRPVLRLKLSVYFTDLLARVQAIENCSPLTLCCYGFPQLLYASIGARRP